MAKVLVEFRDRETWRPWTAGDEFDGTPERVAELAAGGYVEGDKSKPARKRTTRKAATKEG